MNTPVDCRHVRVAVGGDPHDLAPEVREHLATCAACRQFHAETLAMDGRLRAALELPLAKFRKPTSAPARRFALAASVLLAMLLGGGFWMLGSQTALASEVVEHVKHEGGSWEAREVLSASALAEVLKQAGVKFDSSMSVVYASACPFRGHRVPHLVVQTAEGPLTVMLLAHEKMDEREEFAEDGYQGVLVPAGSGSIAILARGDAVPEDVAAKLVSGVRW
jgi:anti-sigma factor RsiW